MLTYLSALQTDLLGRRKLFEIGVHECVFQVRCPSQNLHSSWGVVSGWRGRSLSHSFLFFSHFGLFIIPPLMCGQITDRIR